MNKMSECPKICIIGAGVSGICAGVQLNKKGLKNYTIFDENQEVGGTWLINTYPGCASDVPTHLYSFSFHLNPNWTSMFCRQPEILEYMKEVARTHQLYNHIKFNHQAKRVCWDETIQKWRVAVYDMTAGVEFETIFDIVLLAVGGFRTPNIPKEFESFKGPMMHSARWDSSMKLDGKTVGIIGNGASAIQIIPEIAKSVKKLIVYQRRPTWIFPKPQFNYPPWSKWMLNNLPGLQLVQRTCIFLLTEIHRPVYNFNSLANKIAKILANLFIKTQIRDDRELREKVTPDYAIGCKRIILSSDFYTALKLPHVQVIKTDIRDVTDHSIVTKDGKEETMDVLILATGFKVQDLFAPLEIKAKDGIDLMEVWKKEGPSTYLGIAASVAPNLFLIFGPQASSGNTSAIFSIECQVNWAVGVIQEMVRRGSKKIAVKLEAEKSFMKKLHEDLRSTVWHLGACASWLTNHLGVVTTVSPSTGISLWLNTRNPDFNKLDFD